VAARPGMQTLEHAAAERRSRRAGRALLRHPGQGSPGTPWARRNSHLPL